MSGFVEGIDRSQSTFFPAELEDYVAEDNLVRAVDAFVDGLDLRKLGFVRFAPLDKGRPCYHPATMLKIYIYGYLNRIPSSRRLERECQRNIELFWLTEQLAPDFKTIADFRKDNGKAICEVSYLCGVVPQARFAERGERRHRWFQFKAVNARDKNLTEAKMKRPMTPVTIAKLAPITVICFMTSPVASPAESQYGRRIKQQANRFFGRYTCSNSNLVGCGQ